MLPARTSCLVRLATDQRATVIAMDHEWAVKQLRRFKERIDDLAELQKIYDSGVALTDQQLQDRADIVERWGNYEANVDDLVMLDPAMRILMEAAQPGLGSYDDPAKGGWELSGADYWHSQSRTNALRAIGMHEIGAEARQRMKPDSPDLTADRFHHWVWDAAAPLRFADSRQEAVHAAARSVNARLQQKVDRHDASDANLCRESFSLSDPVLGQPRLRLGAVARTAATSLAPGALRASGIWPRTSTSWTCPSKWPWSSSPPSASLLAGSMSVMSTRASSRPTSTRLMSRSLQFAKART